MTYTPLPIPDKEENVKWYQALLFFIALILVAYIYTHTATIGSWFR